MTDWPRLKHAYGPASDLPGILNALSPDASNPAWDDLWSRICHQGTVYSSSFPALTPLYDTASRWDPPGRVLALSLAGAILSSDDVAGDRERFIRPVESTIANLRALAEQTLASADALTDEDFVYLLEACLALGGDRVWGRALNHLCGGEFPGACPHCRAELYVAIGKFGYFVTADDWVNAPPINRVDITMADVPTLDGVQRWLYDRAVGAGRVQLATFLRHAFGRSACPRCKRELQVSDAIESAAA